MFEEEIRAALEKQVKGDIVLEVPPDPKLGDFAFPCFSLAKEWKKSPGQIAEELSKKIEKPDIVKKIIFNGPYVNFFLDMSKAGKKILDDILKGKERFGKRDAGRGEVVAIDFSHPNIGKPFHFGHLRSTIIGESIGRLLEFRGYKVERLNYLGDWGTQFGALMYAFETWGKEEEFQKAPIEYLVKLYIAFDKEAEKDPALKDKAREWFAKLEQGDERARELWGEFRSQSLAEFKRIYDIFGSKFDSFNGEEYYSRQVPDALEIVKKKGMTELHEGALIARLDGFEVPLILVKSDGSTTYASRDIAALMDRVHNLKASKVLYVVAHEQSLHFKQLFALMGKLGHPEENFYHITFGLYLGSDGQKFSTRKGKIVLMDDVLRETFALALKTIHEKNPDLKNKDTVARQVAVGAMFFGDLVNDRVKDMVFDIERILSFEGDTGPYVQYTHARACSILRRAEEQGVVVKADAALLKDEKETNVLRALMVFSETVDSALKEFKPHILAQYVLALSHRFNEFYHSCPVLREDDADVRAARVALVDAVRQVLENGLRLLCMDAPREM